MTDSKKGPGQPKKVTKEVIDKLEYAFSLDESDVNACYYAGISPATLYNYQNEHPEFLERKKYLKDQMTFKAKIVIDNALNDNDTDMAKFVAKTKGKNQGFTERQEVTGKDGAEFKGLTVEFVEAKKDAD